MKKKALITGITGQDGAYLASFLLKKKYTVYGTTRTLKKNNLRNLSRLNILDSCNILQCDLLNINQTNQIINKINPDEIYNLAGLSSVGKSFIDPINAYRSIILSTVNILENIRLKRNRTKFYLACSSECFGNTKSGSATENTRFNPLSPYAAAKTSSYYITKNYREAYSIFACSGILFNHESPLRNDDFVTQKIITGAISIFNKKKKFLDLGSINIERDWGWAPEYVEAMYLILRQRNPSDYIISSGKSYSLEKFIETVFSYFNLDWKQHVRINNKYKRPMDLTISKGNPYKARKNLKWKPKYDLKKIVHEMINEKLNQN